MSVERHTYLGPLLVCENTYIDTLKRVYGCVKCETSSKHTNRYCIFCGDLLNGYDVKSLKPRVIWYEVSDKIEEAFSPSTYNKKKEIWILNVGEYPRSFHSPYDEQVLQTNEIDKKES